MAKSKRDDDTPKPEPIPRPPTRRPEAPDVMVINTGGGPYAHHRHTKSDRKVGGEVHAMKTESLRVWPGANYRPGDAVAIARDLRGFAARLARREIRVFDSWMAIPRDQRMEWAEKTCDPETLARIIEEETDEAIADVIQAQIDEAATNPRAGHAARARRTQRRLRGAY